RALLPEHGLGADLALALVHADLRAVADPRPAPEPQHRLAADLELHARPDERDPVGLQALAEAQLVSREPQQQPRVLEIEHAVAAHEAHQRHGLLSCHASCRTPWPSACWRATSVRSRARSRSSRTTIPTAGPSSKRSIRTPATPPWSASPARLVPASRR